MPELPEITLLARQMNTYLAGKTFLSIDVFQPKCLNVPVEEFSANLIGSTILSADNRGKWITIRTDHGWLLLNLGMGGEILLVDRQHLPEKRRIIMDFSDGTCLSINFWWFGYAHSLNHFDLEKHEQISKLGPNALDLDEDAFIQRFKNRKGRVKTLLLDQSMISGIGNAYIHDILFLANIHPLRKMETITGEEFKKLYQAVHNGLEPSLSKGGAFYEMDLFGNKGGFLMEDIIIGYRDGQSCPVCNTPIQKIKTGSTSSFICPVCQPEHP